VCAGSIYTASSNHRRRITITVIAIDFACRQATYLTLSLSEGWGNPSSDRQVTWAVSHRVRSRRVNVTRPPRAAHLPGKVSTCGNGRSLESAIASEACVRLCVHYQSWILPQSLCAFTPCHLHTKPAASACLSSSTIQQSHQQT
jgi:hypothetical protein